MFIYMTEEMRRQKEEEAKKYVPEELKVKNPDNTEYANRHGLDTSKYTKKQFDEYVYIMRTGTEEEQKAAREEIGEYTYSYIRRIAKMYCPISVIAYTENMFENLIQAGYVGLFEGLKTYRPDYFYRRRLYDIEHGHMAYLRPYIEREMKEYLNHEINNRNAYTYRNLSAIRDAKWRLESEGNPTDDDSICRKANISKKVLLNTYECVRNSNTVSLDAVMEAKGDVFAADKIEADREAILSDLSDTFRDAFSSLDNEEIFVVTRLFGINCQETTLDELCEMTGRTKDHIKYIRGRALKKLSKNEALQAIYAA